MADVYLSYLRGEQRFGEFARLSAFSALTKLVVMGLGAWLFGVAGAVAGYIVSYASRRPVSGSCCAKSPALGNKSGAKS